MHASAIQAGSHVFSSGTDNAARMFDMSTGQAVQVAQHNAPIKAVRWFEPPYMASGMLVTGSWDKTIKVTYSAQGETASLRSSWSLTRCLWFCCN